MAASEDYIPRNDAEFINWAANFLAVLGANLSELGLVAADLTAVADERTLFSTALTDQIRLQAEAKSAVENKKARRRSFEGLVRPLARRISYHPGMTNDLRARLGLNVPGETRRRLSAGTDVPGVFLETSPGQVLVHFGTDPANEQLNGKPDWAHGCFIYRKKTGESDFSMIAYDTASPYLDRVTGPAVDVTYRVAYRGTRETDIGPMSPEQTIAAGG